MRVSCDMSLWPGLAPLSFVGSSRFHAKNSELQLDSGTQRTPAEELSPYQTAGGTVCDADERW